MRVDMLKIKILPPNKDEMPESLKAIQVSINYNAKMIVIVGERSKKQKFFVLRTRPGPL